MIKRAMTGVKATFVILNMYCPCFHQLAHDGTPCSPACLHRVCVCVHKCVCLEVDFLIINQHYFLIIINFAQSHSLAGSCDEWKRTQRTRTWKKRDGTHSRGTSVIWQQWRHFYLLLWVIICVSGSSSLSVLQCHISLTQASGFS